MQTGIIESVLNFSDKEIKIPENKSLFFNDELYVELFKDGELEAKRRYSKLEIQAMHAGATRAFKKKYDEHRKNLLKIKNATGDIIDIKVFDFPKLKMPVGYKYDMNQGIMLLDNETFEFECVFPQIVAIEERYINIETGEEKNKILFLDRLEKKSLIVDAETISNTRNITKLRNLGVMVTSENAKDLVKFLSALLAANIFTIEPKASISRVGWSKSDFIPYDSQCVFDGEQENKALFDSVCFAGDSQEWINYTKELRKRKLLRLQMAASFASPLISLTGSLPFVFHLWGGTGNGKTVGLMVAMSIWGDPSMGKLTRTMNMTQNSMMTTAAFLHSIPFAGDELQIIKNKWHGYDNLIMAVTEGVDRGRMDGHVNRKTKEWACNFLFTGEEPCTTANSGGGTKNRVIEIECSEVVVAKGNDVVNFVKNNYGFAGEQYIKALSGYDIKEEFKTIFNQLNNAESTEKQTMSLALMLLADKIVSEQLYDDEPLKVSDVAHLLKSSNEVDVSERAYSYLNDLVSINSINFSENAIVKWGKLSDVDNHVVINTTVLNTEMEKQGYSLKAVMGKWIEKGYCLNPTEKSKLYKFGGNVIRGYKIKLQDSYTDEELEELEKLPFL